MGAFRVYYLNGGTVIEDQMPTVRGPVDELFLLLPVECGNKRCAHKITKDGWFRGRVRLGVYKGRRSRRWLGVCGRCGAFGVLRGNLCRRGGRTGGRLLATSCHAEAECDGQQTQYRYPVHHVYLAVAVAFGDKGDLLSVVRPGGVDITGRVVGQPGLIRTVRGSSRISRG